MSIFISGSKVNFLFCCWASNLIIMKTKKFFLLAVLIFSFVSLPAFAEGGIPMKITSPDFRHNGYMPAKFGCHGQGINPGLNVENVPPSAKSLALIVDDPDAPAGTFVHWVVFDIPVTDKIAEDSIPGKQGVNTTGKPNYVSPCPPSGTHRYIFKIYALDTMLNLGENTNKAALEKAIEGHILDKAELIGLYKR